MTTIQRFPTEGRYVPRLTLKTQEVCGQFQGGNERLGRLYLELVPKLVAPARFLQRRSGVFSSN